MKLYAAIIAGLFLTVFSLPVAAEAPETVWRIGTFDRSSAEFADGSPDRATVFVIHRSLPSKNWNAYAPAYFPSHKPDPASAARAIQFSLDSKPAGAYRLRVSLLIEHPSVPTLRVSINSRAGLFYLHPRLDYSMGDTTAAYFPAYSNAEVEFDFPASYLRAGTNAITLQAVATQDKGVPDAGFVYDAVELDRMSHFAAGSALRVEPTIFFKQKGKTLSEQVDVFVRYRGRPHSGQVAIELAGKHYHQPLHSEDDFGEERLSFEIPEFPPGTDAQITLSLDGRIQHFAEKLQPEKKWTLFLVPHVHLDVGYTDYQAKVSTIQSRILDEAMDLTAKHPDFRFSTDGSWNLEQYMKTRTPAEQKHVVQAIQHKQLFAPAQTSNLLTGFPTAETLIRSLYPSANFSRQYGTPFNYANITDVPSYSWSYASVLASAGVPYFIAASNNDRAPVLLQGHLNCSSYSAFLH